MLIIYNYLIIICIIIIIWIEDGDYYNTIICEYIECNATTIILYTEWYIMFNVPIYYTNILRG